MPDTTDGPAEVFEPQGLDADVEPEVTADDAVPDGLPELHEPDDEATPSAEGAGELGTEDNPKPAEPIAADADKAPSDTDQLVADALALGLSEGYVQSLANVDKELLEQAVDERCRTLMAIGDREVAKSGPVPEGGAGATAPAQRPVGVAPTPAKPVADVARELGLDPDMVDPEVIQALQKYDARHSGQLQAVQAVVQDLQRREQERENAQRAQAAGRYAQWLDSKVQTAPDTFKPVLRSPEGRARFEQAINQLVMGMASQGVREIPWDRVAERALRMEFSELNQKAIEKSVVDKTREQLARRERQITPRPTQRTSGVEDTPLRRAHEVAKEIYRRRGIEDPDSGLDLEAVPDALG